MLKQRFSILCISTLLALGTSGLYASKEGIMVFDAFYMHSSGIGSSGPVAITGSQANGRIASLKINAFGREFTLTPEHVKLLADLPINGVQLSFESGYKQLGGRTLYILFTKGFVAQRVAGKLVILKERGSISIKESNPNEVS